VPTHPNEQQHFQDLCLGMSGFELKVIVSRKVVLGLVRTLNVPAPTAEDLAATAFALLWERNPEVKKHIVALLYAQSVYLYRDQRRTQQAILKRVGKYLAHQLDDMLRQADIRQIPAVSGPGSFL
jgi:hypothetical protein